MQTLRPLLVLCALLVHAAAGRGQQPSEQETEFDVVLQGGRVLDPETGLDAVRDVGLRGTRIAEVAPSGLSARLRPGGTLVDAGGLDVPDGTQWLWLAALLAVPGTGHMLMNWAHAHVRLVIASMLNLSVPALSAARRMRAASGMVVARGFSRRTCRPASNASTATCSWSWWGTMMSTASMSPSARALASDP